MSSSSLSPQEHHPIRRWFVVLSAALFFLYEFTQMHMFNAIHKDLMQAFQMNATQLGNLSATYLYADVLFLLPAGIILDRVSTRLVIISSMLLCILATIGFGISTTYLQAASFHFLSGVGNAFCFLCCIRLASRWFPSRMLAYVIGLVVTIAFIGGLLAETPFTVLTHYFPWRHIIFMNAALGAVILLLIVAFVRDYPPSYEHQHLKQQEQLGKFGFWHSLGAALQNKQNWLGGIYTSLMNLPIMILCALWGNMYLEQIHLLTDVQASSVVSMIFIGSIFGCPIIGAWSDKIQLRKLPMMICAVLSIAVVIILLHLNNLSYNALLILFFLIGFFTSAQIIAYPLITESNNRIFTSTATALGSLLIMGGAAIGQNLFGMILDHIGHSTVVNGIHIYPNSSLDEAMLLFPISLCIALLAACFLRETHCREVNTHSQTTIE